MNEHIEKIKAMEPKHLIIIGLAILAIVSLAIGLMMPSDEEETVDLDSLETPDNRKKVEEYNSKLEAYHRNNNESDDVSLEFNLDDYSSEPDSNDPEKDQLEKEVDSLLNANKMTYSEKGNAKPKTQNTTRTNTRAKTPSRTTTLDKKQDINSEFENFFTKSPKSSKNNTVATEPKTDPFIYAVIHGDHTIKQGERVKLRLTKKAVIANMSFSQNSYVYAFPTFSDNRVLLNITSINHVPVSISAYDTEDSAQGLYVKGAKMVGAITDEGSQEAVNDVDVGGVPVGSTIKKVFQKKQQTPTVTLLNNTKLILKPNKR